jgi:hypothetical protein
VLIIITYIGGLTKLKKEQKGKMNVIDGVLTKSTNLKQLSEESI